MVKIRKLSLVLLFCLAFSGCSKQSAVPAAPRLVTEICITGQHQDTVIDRHYTQPLKMESILYYLRGLEDLGKPKTDPERILGDRCKITVWFSDGSQRVYRQQANRFLSRNNRPWHKVDQRKAELLYPLLESLPSDR